MTADIPPAWVNVPLMYVEEVESEFRRTRVRIKPPEDLWFVDENRETHGIELHLAGPEAGNKSALRMIDLGLDGLALATRADLELNEIVEIEARRSATGDVVFSESVEVKNKRKRKMEDERGRKLNIYGAETLHKQNSWLYKTLLDSYFIAQANDLAK